MSPGLFVSHAKASPAKRSDKDYGDENNLVSARQQHHNHLSMSKNHFLTNSHYLSPNELTNPTSDGKTIAASVLKEKTDQAIMIMIMMTIMIMIKKII